MVLVFGSAMIEVVNSWVVTFDRIKLERLSGGHVRGQLPESADLSLMT